MITWSDIKQGLKVAIFAGIILVSLILYFRQEELSMTLLEFMSGSPILTFFIFCIIGQVVIESVKAISKRKNTKV